MLNNVIEGNCIDKAVHSSVEINKHLNVLWKKEPYNYALFVTSATFFPIMDTENQWAIKWTNKILILIL